MVFVWDVRFFIMDSVNKILSTMLCEMFTKSISPFYQ